MDFGADGWAARRRVLGKGSAGDGAGGCGWEAEGGTHRNRHANTRGIRRRRRDGGERPCPTLIDGCWRRRGPSKLSEGQFWREAIEEADISDSLSFPRQRE